MTSIDPEVQELITRAENAVRIPHGLDQTICTPEELHQWQLEREQARDRDAISITRRLNPDREAVRRRVENSICYNPQVTDMDDEIDNITDAVMDLFAQSSVAGETT
jgi:hypothetical protein